MEYKQEIKLLFERLDLDRPGLERVKVVQDSPILAAKELLAYYRDMNSVKHPVNSVCKKI